MMDMVCSWIENHWFWTRYDAAIRLTPNSNVLFAVGDLQIDVITGFTFELSIIICVDEMKYVYIH